MKVGKATEMGYRNQEYSAKTYRDRLELWEKSDNRMKPFKKALFKEVDGWKI